MGAFNLMNRRANTRLSRFSYVLGLIALTVLTGLAITATSTDAAGVRFGFVDTVSSWFGGGTPVDVVAEPQPTPESDSQPSSLPICARTEYVTFAS